MANVFSFETCQAEIIGQLKLLVTNSTLDDWQLLNLTFVCTDIHYDQKFVLCNKFQFLSSFLRIRSKFMKTTVHQSFYP